MAGSTDSQEVEVAVLREGREIKRIWRPVRTINGCSMVVYKRTLYPLMPGSAIELSPTDTPPSPRLDVPVKWDQSQRAVIETAPDQRLLVDAGPGTGKTAVACARVARLIEDCGISPSAIWFVSFTRTAVQEIRHRLRAYLPDGASVLAVKIATIDSHAWALHSGFDGDASLSGGYEENIDRVTHMVRSHEGVFEHLQSVAHVVVDEAQDVTGTRAELVMALIESLPPSCGITIFADEAQAIYGFADEDGRSHASAGGLVQRLRNATVRFTDAALTQVRRTEDGRLRQIFTDVRRTVLDPHAPRDRSRLEIVRQRVVELAHRKVSKLNEAISGGSASESAFVLFRRRADALCASSFQGLFPHRLRMSGFPSVVEPWIGVMFADFTGRRMSRTEFEKRWPRVTSVAPPQLEVNAAWQLLVRLAGESRTVISVMELRKKLARLSPPPEVCRPDFGLPGALFGTIHGSKGREADDVALMLPPNRTRDSEFADPDEEARVLFVGATRARRNLVVVDPYSSVVRRTESGRACILRNDGTSRAQVEIGRERDLSVTGLAGKARFADAGDVNSAQSWLLQNCNRMAGAVANTRGSDFAYHVSVQLDAPAFVVLEKHVNDDLFEVGALVADYLGINTRLRPAGLIPHIRIFGARTCAVPVGVDAGGLHEPWSVSGFMLAPLVQAFTMVEFKPL